MADSVADKIKKTQNSFPPQQPGAVVAACPLKAAPPVPPQPSSPVDLTTAFMLTQEMIKPPVAVAAEAPPKKAWIEILLVDMDNQPMPGVRYRITPPGGGAPKEGVLNENGQAGYYQIESGNCKITFPDLDAEAWEER